jgi:hypothetical protein
MKDAQLSSFDTVAKRYKICFTKESLEQARMPMDKAQTPKPSQSAPSSSSSAGSPSATKTSSAFSSTSSENPVMQSFKAPTDGPSGMKVLLVLLVMAALGVGTGYAVASYSAQPGHSIVPKALNPGAPAKGQTFGDGDAATFKDTAEGVLKDGGIDGEGQYHLVRTGGDSQNVYLTSSTLDLSKFIDQKIKVWGQTQAAQKAGWLMDVGKVQVE